MLGVANPRSLLALFSLAGFAVAQSTPCFENSLGVALNLQDDDVQAGLQLGFTFPGPGGTYTEIAVSSNGFVWLGPVTGFDPGCCNGDVAAFLANGPRVAAMWEDLYPPGGGDVYFNTFPPSSSAPARAVITWSAVHEYYTGPIITVQVQLLATGEILISHDAANSVSAHSPLIGVTPGNNAIAIFVDFGPIGNGSVDTGTIATAYQWYANPLAYDLAGITVLFTPNGYGGYVITQSCSPGPHASYGVYGAGCARQDVAFYQSFAAGTVDVGNQSFAFEPSSIGAWRVGHGSGAWFANLGNDLHLGDEGVAHVALPFTFPHMRGSTNTISVSANGFVWLGDVDDAGCCSGDLPRFLATDPRIAVLWQDLDPSAGGAVYADADPANSAFVVTWDNVREYAGTATNTCQLVMYPSGGFELRYAQVANDRHACLVGYSAGNGQADPGNRSLVASTPFGSSHAPVLALDTVQSGDRPLLGSTFQQRLFNTPYGAQLAFLVVGLTDLSPGGVDLGLYGMPDCFLWASPDATVVQQLGNPTIFALAIPNVSALADVIVLNQVVVLAPGVNDLGAVVSNGARLVLGR